MARAENWRSVPGYPDIEISDELVVRSKELARTGVRSFRFVGPSRDPLLSVEGSHDPEAAQGRLPDGVRQQRPQAGRSARHRLCGLPRSVSGWQALRSPPGWQSRELRAGQPLLGRPCRQCQGCLGARRDRSRRRPRQGEADRRRCACDPVRNGPDPRSRQEVRCLCNNHPPGAHRRDLGSHLKEFPRGSHRDDRR